jgi:hypothetical protein
VAAAGYGKTTALCRRLSGATWLSGTGVDELIAGGLKRSCTDQPPQWIVLDDLPRLSVDPPTLSWRPPSACPDGLCRAGSRWPVAAPLSR